ncbi:hypothetical protein PVAND_000270 [Polypedilum vanderplanki]|uniref:P-type domain-containing protein n=1 Tax=Polypedilum vanderplanki TaxID=319348 RepID=A0A9J6BJK6_POLVA|nr:hypothetical protein PVAND_000270 [Polypedilum vanderplanki]
MSDDRKSEVRIKKLTDDFEFQHDDGGKPSIIHVIFLNRTLRILCALGVFSMLIPILDYFYFYSTEADEYKIDDSGICSHYPIYQISCGSENISETECIENDCCYSKTFGCYHFLPSKYQLIAERHWNDGSELQLVPTKEFSPIKTKTFPIMKFDIEKVSEEILTLILWNPSLELRIRKNDKKTNSSYKYDIKVFSSPELFIEVRRKIDNQSILSTTRGALIASENYFEWSVHLGSGDIKLMGFDTTDLRDGQRILINNAYSSVIPYVVAYDRQSKHYHAVHFESIESPAELQILKSNTIIIRQYSSAKFRMSVFVGPTYGDIYRQLKSSTEQQRMVSEFWSFGVHFCPINSIYNETETRIELNYLLENLRAIPFDSHCINSDLTALIASHDDNNALEDYTEILQRLQAANKKLLLHMTLTAIENNNSTENLHNLALTDDDESIFIGLYGKRKVFYLDYITKSQEIANWFIHSHLNRTFIQSNGIMLFRTFPFDDTFNKSLKYLEHFQFHPKNFENAIEQLIPLNVKLQSGEPLIHQLNNYGHQQIEVFHATLNNGKFCIADTFSKSCGMLMRVERASWTNFQAAIYKSVFYSLIGMSFYGIEVCGSDIGNIPEDLCIRWYQFAIFMPLFYVNSKQMPMKFTKYAEHIMVHAIRTRYSLLSYMRTCMYSNLPLLRPLYVEYDSITFDNDNLIELISNQLMFGNALMIAPIAEPLVVEVELYFPERYFELWSGMEMPQQTHFSIVMHDIPIFIRAGHIIALNLAYESVSVEEAMLEPYLLIVALSCNEKFNCHANGRQIIADGVEFEFKANESEIFVTLIATNDGQNAICGQEKIASSEFKFAKIYGLNDFKEKYKNNEYLPLNFNFCDAENFKIEI